MRSKSSPCPLTALSLSGISTQALKANERAKILSAFTYFWSAITRLHLHKR